MQTLTEKRNLKNKQFIDAFTATYEVIERVKNPRKGADEIETRAYEAATIQHFEICYELFWKYLKLILEEDFKIFVASPKAVFHECLKQKTITQEEADLLLEMSDDRNSTSHIYDKILAKEIFMGIDKHIDLMKKIFDEINSK